VLSLEVTSSGVQFDRLGSISLEHVERELKSSPYRLIYPADSLPHSTNSLAHIYRRADSKRHHVDGSEGCHPLSTHPCSSWEAHV
jgi:hypothetical protein